jgi:hypothetical protein
MLATVSDCFSSSAVVFLFIPSFSYKAQKAERAAQRKRDKDGGGGGGRR